MRKLFEKLKEFNKAFGIPFNGRPRLTSLGNARLRHDLMLEENEEYLLAVKEGDIVEIGDALTDQLYVLTGTILSHGFQHIIEDLFDEVHSSNMSKLDEDGNPIINGKNGVRDLSKPDGKVLKSAKYHAPNLAPKIHNAVQLGNFNELTSLTMQRNSAERVARATVLESVRAQYKHKVDELNKEIEYLTY